MVESAALGSACGVALGTPWIWILARWGGAQSGAFRVPPVTYGIAVALGLALFLVCNLLAGLGLLLLLGRPLEPTFLGPLVRAGLSGGCLLVLPLAPWLPLVVGLRLHPAWRVALMLLLTALLAAGFCPNPAAVSAQDGAMMGELLLASVGSIALLAAIQPPRSSPEPFHAHRHPR